ncbi:MAG: YHYH protein, partial [Verrucomicrobiota bacterium]
NQAMPTYPGVHEISYSADWVYIRTTGLGGHIMGPWYLDAGKTQLFPNYPANTATIFRFPLNPGPPPAVKSLTTLGSIGYFVDGVAMFDSRDAFSYSNGNGADSTPMTMFTGDGIWNRDAYVNEGITFDAAFAHQASSTYHYHANPIALRHQLDDHVDYNPAANQYTERSTEAVHSPILGWLDDGLPIYGPYGYDNPTDAASPVRRMRSGFRARSITQREVLPAWAARVQGYTAAGNTNEYALAANEYGPDVNPTYVLGHYLEDHEYLGDVGQTIGVDFDLDEHNGRFCVTPEFPAGTYAYFTCITSNGMPIYPYNVGRTFYGDPTGDTLNEIAEPVTLHAEGGPEQPIRIEAPIVDAATDEVTLQYSAVEGGYYRVEATDDLIGSNWVTIASNLHAQTELLQFVDTNGLDGADRRYYRTALYDLDPFDDTGFVYDSGEDPGPTDPGVHPDSGARGNTIEITIIFDAGILPPLPPAAVPVNSVTVGGINATGISRPDQTTVIATITIPPGATPGLVNVIVSFPGPSYTLTDAFTIL